MTATLTEWFTLARLRHAIQVMVAALAAYLVVTAFALPQGYWAVMTAILIVQTNVGATLGQAIDWAIATSIGAVGGLACVLAVPAGPYRVPIALAASILLLQWFSSGRPRYRLAPVTAAIVVLSDPGQIGPVTAAVDRVLEILAGAAVALPVCVLLLPSRAGQMLASQTSTILEKMADHLDSVVTAVMGAPQDPDAYRAQVEDVQNAIIVGDTRVTEARQEIAGGISSHLDPLAVQRALRRVWYSQVLAGRAAGQALPDHVAAALGPALTGFGQAAGDYLRALARAGATASVPSMDRVAAARAALHTALAGLRARDGTRDLPTDVAEYVFALVFGLEQMAETMQDLADCLTELRAGRRR